MYLFSGRRSDGFFLVFLLFFGSGGSSLLFFSGGFGGRGFFLLFFRSGTFRDFGVDVGEDAFEEEGDEPDARGDEAGGGGGADLVGGGVVSELGAAVFFGVESEADDPLEDAEDEGDEAETEVDFTDDEGLDEDEVVEDAVEGEDGEDTDEDDGDEGEGAAGFDHFEALVAVDGRLLQVLADGVGAADLRADAVVGVLVLGGAAGVFEPGGTASDHEENEGNGVEEGENNSFSKSHCFFFLEDFKFFNVFNDLKKEKC